MSGKRYRLRMLVLVVTAMAILVPTVVGAQTGEEWIRIQNGSQGYALYCPKSATVRRFDPEGILHIELSPEQQVMQIRVLDNPDRLSAEQWTDDWLSGERTQTTDEFKPMSPVITRSHISIKGKRAETLVFAGPLSLRRQTVLTSGDRVYLANYPVGHTSKESVFDRIVATFEIGAFADDSGLQVIEPNSTESIAALPVPYYSQADPQWICDRLGTCNCDFGICTAETHTGIGDAGCFITSQAMIFEYYTTNHFKNPKEFDTCLTNNSGYGSWSGCAYGLCGASYLPPSACYPSSVSYEGYTTNLTVLDSDLSNGRPAILWVDGGDHYVVAIGKSSGNYQIHDPYYSRSQVSPGDILRVIRYSGSVPDSEAPNTSASLSGPAGENGWYYSDVQVTLTASDNDGGSGVDLVQYEIDDGSWQGYSNPFTVSGEGDHSVYYKAQDKAGNWESQKRVPVPIDPTAPTGSFVLDKGAATAPGVLVQVNPSAIDATSGVHQMRLRDAGGSWSDWQSYSDLAFWQLPPVTGNSYTVEIQFKDWAGNESTVYQDAITLDVYPPRLSSAAYRLGRSTWGAAPWDKQSINYHLLGTVGQSSIVGVLASTNYRLRSGYWTEHSETYAVYLPLTLRQFP
jgi:hypothetical protein